MREVTVRVLDDLDKTSDVQETGGKTVTLGYQGEWLSLDLSGEHVRELERLLRPYLLAGRKTSGDLPVPLPGSMTPREFSKSAREWGRDNGWPDTQPGYTPRALKKAYREYLEKQALEQL